MSCSTPAAVRSTGTLYAAAHVGPWIAVLCGVRDHGKADCNQRNPGTARLLPKGLLRYAGIRLACLRSSVGRRPAAVVTWGHRVLRQRRYNGWKSRKLPGRLASETDCHVQLKVSWPLTGQLTHTAPSQIDSRGQSADRDVPRHFRRRAASGAKRTFTNTHDSEFAINCAGHLKQ
jgi:hypothetical protein